MSEREEQEAHREESEDDFVDVEEDDTANQTGLDTTVDSTATTVLESSRDTSAAATAAKDQPKELQFFYEDVVSPSGIYNKSQNLFSNSMCRNFPPKFPYEGPTTKYERI